MQNFSINQLRQTVLAVIQSNGLGDDIKVFQRNGLEITDVRLFPSGAVHLECINDYGQRHDAGGYIAQPIVDRVTEFSL